MPITFSLTAYTRLSVRLWKKRKRTHDNRTKFCACGWFVAAPWTSGSGTVRKGGFAESSLAILLLFIDFFFLWKSNITPFLQPGGQRVRSLTVPKDSCTVSRWLKKLCKSSYRIVDYKKWKLKSLKKHFQIQLRLLKSKYKREVRLYKLTNNLLQLLKIYLEAAKYFGFVIDWNKNLKGWTKSFK